MRDFISYGSVMRATSAIMLHTNARTGGGSHACRQERASTLRRVDAPGCCHTVDDEVGAWAHLTLGFHPGCAARAQQEEEWWMADLCTQTQDMLR